MNIKDLYAKKHWLDIAKAQSYTTRLLVRTDKNYKVHGTAVFIKLNENYFLLTAAHVIDAYDDLMIPIGTDTLLKPGGHINYSNFSGSREDDPIDIAFMKLDDYTVNELKNYYNFLNENDLLFENELKPKPYTFLGYPTTYSRYSSTSQSFHSNVFYSFSYSEPLETYKVLDRNPDKNIIVKYNRKHSINTKIIDISRGPDLYGMSGCGLWYTDPQEILYPNSVPKLAAIMTDWPKKNKTVVIGTRINLIIQAIIQEFDII